MMRIPQTTWLSAILFALVFTACQREAPVPDDSLVFLPENTAMVTAIRARQLMDKADFQAIKQSEGYQEMIREAQATNPVLAKVLEQPESSGVDLGKNIYLSAEMRENQKPLISISFSIADVKAFEALLKSADVEVRPAADKGYHLASPSRNSALAWNDKVAIIGVTEDDTDVQAEMKRYLEGQPERSIAQNKNLRRTLVQEFDIANWVSSDFLLDSEMAKGSSALLNYSEEDLRGNYIQHFLTFEKGLVKSKADFYFKNRIANDLSMLFRDKVKTDFVKLAPEGEALFFMATAFDMDGINQLLIEKYSKGLAEGGLQEYGISTATLMKALKGDIMLAAYPPAGDKEEPALVFAARIGDEKALESIISLALKENKIEKVGENRYQFLEWKREMKEDSTFAETKIKIDGQILLHNGLLYMASQTALLDKVENGQTGLSGPAAEQAKTLSRNNIFTALGDIESLEALGKSRDGEDKAFNSIEATANRKGAELLLYMKDESSNSLKTLIDGMKRPERGEAPSPEETESSEI